MEKKTAKKVNTVATASKEALIVASYLTGSIQDLVKAQAKFQVGQAGALGEMADRFQLELDPEGTNTCKYQDYKDVRGKVIGDLQLAQNGGMANSTATRGWEDFVKFLKSDRDFIQPKAPSKQAVSNEKLKVEMDALSDDDLTLAEFDATKLKDYTKAGQYQKESARRLKVSEGEQKRTDGKALTSMKNALKKWVGKMDAPQIVALSWLQQNPKAFAELVKKSSK
tara:strand:- start:98 stop:772 length:675 start_codon:yes stop_codon:yes gene_type:complete